MDRRLKTLNGQMQAMLSELATLAHAEPHGPHWPALRAFHEQLGAILTSVDLAQVRAAEAAQAGRAAKEALLALLTSHREDIDYMELDVAWVEQHEDAAFAPYATAVEEIKGLLALFSPLRREPVATRRERELLMKECDVYQGEITRYLGVIHEGVSSSPTASADGQVAAEAVLVQSPADPPAEEPQLTSVPAEAPAPTVPIEASEPEKEDVPASIELVPPEVDEADEPTVLREPAVTEPEEAIETEADAAVPAADVEPVALDAPIVQTADVEALPAPLNECAGLVESVFWECVGRSDFAAAHWLASAGSPGGESMVPAWLMKAALLARCLEPARDDAHTVLYEIMYDHQRPADDARREAIHLTHDDVRLCIAASALRPSIVCPDMGANDWLRQVINLSGDPLDQLADAALELSQTSMALGMRLSDLHDPAGAVERRPEEYRARAARWISSYRDSHFNYSPATKVARHLASPASDLGRAMDTVVHGDIRDPHQVHLIQTITEGVLASHKAKDDYVQTEANRVWDRPSSVHITGPILRALLMRLSEAREILAGWLRCAEALRATNWDRREQQYAALCHRVTEAVRSTIAALSAPDDWALNTRTGLRTAFAMTLSAFLAELEGDDPIRLRDWAEALREPLLFVRRIPERLPDQLPSRLSAAMVSELATALRDELTLAQVAVKHIEDEDFAMADLVIRSIGRDEERAPLSAQVNERRSLARDSFRIRVLELRRDLEQAMIDFGLDDSEHSEMESRMLGLEQREASSDRYWELNGELDSIRDQLARQRHHRAAQLRTNLADLRDQAESDPGAAQKGITDTLAKAEAALGRDDLAVAVEYISIAERAIDTGESIQLSAPDDETEWFGDFQTAFNALHKALEDDENRLRDRLVRRESVAGLDMSKVPGARSQEIRLALETYSTLKRVLRQSLDKKPHRTSLHGIQLDSILSYLGFQSIGEPSLHSLHQNAAHYRVSMSAGSFATLPHFGTYREGEYDVLIVSGRPNADNLGQLVISTGLQEKAPLVIFLGRMTPKQREEWGEHCAKNQLTVLLIDEILLYFLASIRDNRLAACIACSMPWGYANPYTPYTSNVSPEMFKGRHRAINELIDPRRTAIIYGGRQLGKSAILRAIERRVHDPSRKSYAFLEDIKSLGDPRSDQLTSNIWRRLHDRAVKAKLLAPTVLETNVKDELLRALTERYPDARVLFLLDEADNFFAADARSNFDEVQKLKQLMDATNRRFKVVFSGLHSVQRYANIPNHPFAHLGEPVNIGPLDPRDGLALVKEPLTALGYRFDDDDPALRILAYTNYNPALIQHFCSELVREHRGVKPPYKIDMNRVFAVYRKAEVRRIMLDRFEMTITLDPRYAVLVYTMVLEQTSSLNGYRQEFGPREAYARAVQLCPAFGQTSADEVRHLLDELVGLGILVRRESGRYRLRNSNVVHALGPAADIYERLDEIEGRLSSVQFEPQIIRAPIERQTCAWSPLSLDAERSLLKGSGGVGLAFASVAHGEPLLRQALDRDDGVKAEDQGPLIITPADVLSIASFRSFLDHNIKDAGRFVIILPASQLLRFAEPLASAATGVRKAIEYFRWRRTRQRSVHLIITFDAKSTFAWYAHPGAVWRSIEDASDTIVTAQVWPPAMIERFIQYYEGKLSRTVVQGLVDTTGGWLWLLQALFDRLRKKQGGENDIMLQPEGEARQLLLDLEQNRDGLRDRFLTAVGIDESQYGLPIIRSVSAYEYVGIDELTPNLCECQGTEAEMAGAVEALLRLGALVRQEDTIRCDPLIQRIMKP